MGRHSKKWRRGADLEEVCSKGAVAASHRRLDLLMLVMLLGTSLSVIWHYIHAAYLKSSYPLTTFLHDPADALTDFTMTIRDVSLFNKSSGGVVMAYTPIQHFILYLEIKLGDLLGIRPAMVFLTIIAFAVLLVWYLRFFFTSRDMARARNAQRVFILGAFSYPVLFVIDRGNTEMFVFAAVLGFVYFYYMRPRRWLWIACLALAASFKIYPVVLILIPLSDRRFRDVGYVLLAAAGGTLLALGLIGVQSHYGFMGVTRLWARYLLHGQGGLESTWWMGMQHGHSLWGAAYLVDVFVGKPFTLSVLRRAYAVCAIVIALAGAAWIYFGRLRAWEKLAIAVFMYLLLPFSSHDYTLLHVYFPLAAFVDSGEPLPFDRTLTVLFGMLLVPLDYYYFAQHPDFWPAELHGRWPALAASDFGHLMGITVLVYPAIMLGIIFLIAWRRRSRAMARLATTSEAVV